MRLFLDANVLFTAAHNPNGKAALVLELATAGLWQAVTSAYALEEARRNLKRKYPACLAELDKRAAEIRLVVDSGRGDCPQGLIEKDCPIYRAARACQADVLLTGDIRDFGFLMNAPDKTEGMCIQTVAEFLERLSSSMSSSSP
ncbi:PIN domain-containing protein [Lamprobacter modestohalophilus]|uniref:PIN domain-containing protein n=1 Tax=Lamprobacter modestohalophilus TaxID=1064514 RepID=UPI002ADEDD42|nr:PIN domain-containing protein [Lamprobacter modestohalophilus]MEA1049040.1 PIN domain-containing protein [Lamprobacter modestohalophilus]